MRVPTNRDIWDFFNRYALVLIFVVLIGVVGVRWFGKVINPPPVEITPLLTVQPGQKVIFNNEFYTVTKAEEFRGIGKVWIELQGKEN